MLRMNMWIRLTKGYSHKAMKGLEGLTHALGKPCTVLSLLVDVILQYPVADVLQRFQQAQLSEIIRQSHVWGIIHLVYKRTKIKERHKCEKQIQIKIMKIIYKQPWSWNTRNARVNGLYFLKRRKGGRGYCTWKISMREVGFTLVVNFSSVLLEGCTVKWIKGNLGQE